MSEDLKFDQSLKASLMQRPYQLFQNLQRTDVLAELALGSISILGFVYSGILMKRSWQKRQFLNTLNLSLNSYCTTSRTFKFRTLMEANDLKVFVPEAAISHLTSAAKQTKSEDNYIIKMNPITYDLICVALVNSLSEKCAEGFLARDMGSQQILAEKYVMCLTAEDTKVSKQHKIRAMIMQ